MTATTNDDGTPEVYRRLVAPVPVPVRAGVVCLVLLLLFNLYGGGGDSRPDDVSPDVVHVTLRNIAGTDLEVMVGDQVVVVRGDEVRLADVARDDTVVLVGGPGSSQPPTSGTSTPDSSDPATSDTTTPEGSEPPTSEAESTSTTEPGGTDLTTPDPPATVDPTEQPAPAGFRGPSEPATYPLSAVDGDVGAVVVLVDRGRLIGVELAPQVVSTDGGTVDGTRVTVVNAGDQTLFVSADETTCAVLEPGESLSQRRSPAESAAAVGIAEGAVGSGCPDDYLTLTRSDDGGPMPFWVWDGDGVRAFDDQPVPLPSDLADEGDDD